MRSYFKRNIAITNEHGSWVFLLSPLLIGLFAGQSWNWPALYLVVAALAAFLARHPIIIMVKIASGRRARRDLAAAWFWTALYSSLALLMVAALVWRGFGYLLYLALPGLPVFAWHLWLVSRRRERRQMAVELVASGVLALSAPAAYWVGVGEPDMLGWVLWLLTWLQSAASIVYAYLRLEQRILPAQPSLKVRLEMGWRALAYAGFNLAVTLGLSLGGLLPEWLFLPYLLQFAETVWGSLFSPAVGVKPTRIGLRQLVVSSLYTLLFIVTWQI